MSSEKLRLIDCTDSTSLTYFRAEVGAEVKTVDNSVFVKKMCEKEKRRYQFFRKQIVSTNVSAEKQNLKIVIPLILCDLEKDEVWLTSPPFFHLNGKHDYSKVAYLSVIRAIRLLSEISISGYESDFSIADQEDLDSVISFLESLFQNQQIQDMFDFSQIKTLVKKTQTHIELLPRHFSHGDLHNGNWSYHKLHNEDVISLIDMETSGLYRFGWDIGRMYTYLAGYPQDQEGLLEAITESLLSENEHIYFWRTVLIRSIRNIWGILNNRTVYGLSDQQKEERIKDLKQNVITASDFLEKV